MSEIPYPYGAEGALAVAPPERPATPVDSLADYLSRLKIIHTRIKDLQTEADGIKAAIQDALGDYEIGTVHGRPVVSWTHHVRHALDQKALKRAEPRLYEAYLKATTVRRFVVLEDQADDE